eukprot:scaffold23479_cov143-Cylindrotheca_fusiformis.AAC.14
MSDGGNEDDPTSNKAMVTKVCLAAGIFVLGFLSTLLPRYFAVTNGAQRWISLGNMAASGILLAAGLVHMLADSSGDLDSDEGFPWAFFVAGMTFVGLMILEEGTHLIAMTMNSKNSANEYEQDGEAGHQTSSQPYAEEDQALHSEGESLLTSRIKLGNEAHLIPRPYPIRKAKSGPACLGIPSLTYARPLYGIEHTNDTLHSEGSEVPTTMECPPSTEKANNPRSDSNQPANPQPAQHHHHEDHVSLHVRGSIIATCVLMLAISVHSILAGISMGVESSYKHLLSTAIAILAHKAFVGFALGSSLVNAQIGPSAGFIFWFFSLGFALTTPIGVFIGMGIVKAESGDPDGTHAVALIKAIVSGTFLYISIVEIGTKELMTCRTEYEKHGSLAQKLWDVANLVVFAAGYGAMASLALAV